MKKRIFTTLCAAVLCIAALAFPASAASTPSIEEQMAANSAAWHIAKENGDTATMDALHAANEQLAAQAAAGGGNSSYNSGTGTWNITTSSGSNISSSSTYNGGSSSNITYTNTSSTGTVSSTTQRTYGDNSINAYYNYGGTDQGLQNAYNSAGSRVTTSTNYGGNTETTSAADEAAVAKKLLGLTDAEAAKLQADIEASKQAYNSASVAYNQAIARGDTAAAAAAKAQMDAAHDEAQALRANYGYTGDDVNADDGGYFYTQNGSGAGSTTNPNYGLYLPTGTNEYRITASADGGGTISPNGSVTVKRGANQAFTISANTGYTINSVIVDGVDQGAIGSYTFSSVRSSHTIRATFAPKTYNITASAGTGGSISPSGTTKVTHGANQSYTIKPNTGYVVSAVTVDGVNKGALTSYTFNSVSAPHTISVKFEKADCTITATAGPGGSISPAGANNVQYGGTKTFTITPSTGYEIAVVTVDGTNVGKPSTYTFNNVTTAHTIKAEFKPNGKISIDRITLTDTLGTSLSDKALKSGYGIMVKVPVTSSGVTGISVKLTYNFGDGAKSVILDKIGNDYVFPVNSTSPTGARCIYVPVATADGTYTIKVTASALDASGSPVSDTATATVTIHGSMYEDDFTGDS